MHRKIEKELKIWQENYKMPLMLVGARQTGKTYILDTFCKTNYKNYNGPKKLLLFKKASHGISYLVEPDKYIEAVKDFVNKGE